MGGNKNFRVRDQNINMAELGTSNLVAILTVLFVVVGLVLAILYFFKRAENLTDEDRFHIERTKILWLGATALGVLTLVAVKREKGVHKSMGGRGSATLL